MDPIWAEGEIPFLTTEQMVEVDRAMIEDFGIDLVRMMENAGRSLAHLARERFLGGNPEGKAVVVLAGTGGNGGGALVAARRLHGYGAKVSVGVARRSTQMTAVAGQQLAILEEMGVPIVVGAPPDVTPDLILDGLIGYSLRGAPRGISAELIRWANETLAAVLSLDVPSGLDTTTGTVFDPVIRADATMTLALPKAGLRVPEAGRVVGELYLADISVPPELYA
ncbi:MAG: NAD(P)H-hydrate epimerase, partial [Actinomycetia bacterium]|nr:NAD(P)H-hydrate epimerase [Actinomycetes bacterium]